MRDILGTGRNRPACAAWRVVTNRSFFGTKISNKGTGARPSQITYLCALALASPRLGRFIVRACKASVGGAETQEKEIIMSKPAHKIRSGVLQATIWRNHGEKGNWYSVIPARSFKQGDETWKETDSLGFDDL